MNDIKFPDFKKTILKLKNGRPKTSYLDSWTCGLFENGDYELVNPDKEELITYEFTYPYPMYGEGYDITHTIVIIANNELQEPVSETSIKDDAIRFDLTETMIESLRKNQGIPYNIFEFSPVDGLCSTHHITEMSDIISHCFMQEAKVKGQLYD